MTIAEVIQALRDADLQDDAETDITEIEVSRGSFYKIQARTLRDADDDDFDEDDD